MWFRHPLLVSSCRWLLRSNRVGTAIKPAATVTKRIRRRGERGINRKAITQGMPDASAEPVCSCAFLRTILHTRPRVQRAPGIPCALSFSRVTPVKTRAHRAARQRRYAFYEARHGWGNGTYGALNSNFKFDQALHEDCQCLLKGLNGDLNAGGYFLHLLSASAQVVAGPNICIYWCRDGRSFEPPELLPAPGGRGFLLRER